MNTTTTNTDTNKRIVDFKSLLIKLASPESIKSWSHGEVTKPETINYRTLKPEKDGLFDERIFGPVKDWECFCGKYKRIRYKGIICDKCGVEVTQSRVRRERMGHLTLAAPVAHVWFFKGAPSKLSLLLDVSPRSLEAIIYFAEYVVTDIDPEGKKKIIESLGEQQSGREEELRKSTEQKIKDLQGELDEEVSQIKGKLKGDQLSLATEELEHKYKQRVQALRDSLVVDLSQLGEIYKKIEALTKSLHVQGVLTEDEYEKLLDYDAADFFKVGMGAEAILEIVKKINLEKLASELKEEISTSTGQRYVKAIKRLRVVEGMRKATVNPAWMITKILPVIPPDLRPMVQLSGGRFATSDLNDLYRRVINRNNRLKHLMDLGAPEIILRNEKRMLQEAVDSLIDSSQRTSARRTRPQMELRSLSEMLKGKQGRFRQNLLGKRVDYSGRSVIVVGPELTLNQVGIPKDMALEMFKPFVLRQMLVQGLAPNVKSAKNILERRPPEVFDILEDITRDHPVLLNRAPTLHKLGIQAFYPTLIEGNAIRIHPCVCDGFNADFDGDQMAVHVPLSKKAQEEAIAIMMPTENLLKPADGTPITVPRREMALGTFYLTTINDSLPEVTTVFANEEEVMFAKEMGVISWQQLIKVRMGGQIIETTAGRIRFNEALPASLRFVNEHVDANKIKALLTKALAELPNEEIMKLIDGIKTTGFFGSTLSGVSVAITDSIKANEKVGIIDQANQQVAEIENNFRLGLITSDEKRRLTHEIWMDTTEDIADITWEKFEKQNPIRIIIDSKASRASRDQVKQLSAMRGLSVDPMGRIVELPTKSNFREGLSIFEYVNAARGGRKGLTDSAIKTAGAGYLTRRLVDVSHDALVRNEDCHSGDYIEVRKDDKRAKSFGLRILGRTAALDIVDGKTLIVPKGTVIDENTLPQIVGAESITSVSLRTPLGCKAKYGLCMACYGWDLATKKAVEIGVPVGVLAAQSIGEPGTQLTMRTKHAAGTVGLDVTQGLPRVEELFEARTPKTLSPLSEISGKVEVIETDEGYKVRVKSVGIKPVEEREYIIPLTAELRVKNGDLVSAGAQLASGSLDIKEVLEVRGLRGAQEYLIEEIQAVYESQGISINDKHFEVIVKRMSDKVRINTAGDTSLLPGEVMDRYRFEDENAKTMAEGGEPATAQVIILGITRSALHTESWLSAASFIQTTERLTEAAVMGKEDKLIGLKENVIIGRLIPTHPDRARIEM
jgi:DNA-directed RNA polymerase subunit beta'